MVQINFDRSNPIIGGLGIIFLVYLSWKRWHVPANQVVANTGRAQDIPIVKPYKTIKWFVAIKLIIAIAILIWWLTLEVNTLAIPDIINVLFNKLELLTLPIMIMSLDKRCKFPKPKIDLSTLLIHSLLWFILLPIDCYRALAYRWNKHYSDELRCTYTVWLTRVSHIIFMCYGIWSFFVFLTRLVKNTKCSHMKALYVYILVSIILLIIYKFTVRWKKHTPIGVDCVYLLMIINVFFSAFAASKVDQDTTCFVVKCEDRCLLTFNAENWNYVNFADALSVW